MPGIRVAARGHRGDSVGTAELCGVALSCLLYTSDPPDSLFLEVGKFIFDIIRKKELDPFYGMFLKIFPVFFQTSKARPLLRYSSLDPATLPLAVISHPRNRKAYAGAQVAISKSGKTINVLIRI